MLLDTTFPLPEACSLQQWKKQLEAELPFELIEIDTPQHQRVHYYDSFDRLFYRAGETVEWHENEPSSSLLLRTGINGPIKDQVAFDSPPPRFPAELPRGRLRKTLTQRLGVRAMLPVAVVETDSQRLRVVDKNLKSLAFLFLSQHSVINSDGKPVFIRKDIRIQPLRKHVKTADKLARYIESHWNLQHDDQSLLDLALPGLGKQAATYSGKLAVPLQADMRADAAMRKILRVLLETMEFNEQGTIDNLDTEFLHDFRIAVRRTRSALTQMKSVFPAQSTARFAKTFAWLGDITTPTRDLDVHLLKFNSLQKSLPRTMRDDLEPLRQFLTVQQQQEQTKLASNLKSSTYRRIKEQWHRFLTSPLPMHPSAPDALKPTSEIAHRRIWRMYRRVLREGRAITSASPATDLHELRKSCKKLRYLMEFFQSLYPAEKIRRLIRELKGLQDNLGDFQDLEVQMYTLEQYREQMTHDDVIPPRTRIAFDTLLEHLHTSAESVRNNFASRFEQFSSKPNRRRFKLLFHSENARPVNIPET